MIVVHQAWQFCVTAVQKAMLKARTNRRIFREANDKSGQIIPTSAEVTLNGGLIRELPQKPLNSGLGIILIWPDKC